MSELTREMILFVNHAKHLVKDCFNIFFLEVAFKCLYVRLSINYFICKKNRLGTRIKRMGMRKSLSIQERKYPL
jgi:hypothetical protein